MNSSPPEAKDLGQAILVLGFLSRDIQALTLEIQTLRETMATREELYSVRDQLNLRMDALQAQMKAQSVGSTFDRWLSLVTRVGAALVVLGAAGGLIFAFVRYVDHLPR